MQWKKKLNSSVPLIPDPKGQLVKLYGVKMPLINIAKRWTFLVNRKQIITRIDTGGDAIKAHHVIEACTVLDATQSIQLHPEKK